MTRVTTTDRRITRDQRANDKCELRARADDRGLLQFLLASTVMSPELGASFPMFWPQLEANCVIPLLNLIAPFEQGRQHCMGSKRKGGGVTTIVSL